MILRFCWGFLCLGTTAVRALFSEPLTGHDVKLELKPELGGVSQIGFQVAAGADTGRASSTLFTMVNGINGDLMVFADSIPSNQSLLHIITTGPVPPALPMPLSHAVIPSRQEQNTSNISLTTPGPNMDDNSTGFRHRSSSNGSDPYDFRFRSQVNAKHKRTSSLRRRLAEQAPVSNANEISNAVVVAAALLSTGAMGSTASGPVEAFGGRPQHKMLIHEDFHLDTVSGWQNSGTETPLPHDNSIGTCSRSASSSAAGSASSAHMSDFFLGPFRDATTSKTFQLPAHSRLIIQARVHFLDAWTGESVFLAVTDSDGNQEKIWSRAHKWCDKLLPTLCKPREEGSDDSEGKTINVCGNPSYPDSLSVPMEVHLSHSADEIKISFGSTLKQGTQPSGPAWAIDDLRISI